MGGEGDTCWSDGRGEGTGEIGMVVVGKEGCGLD